MEPVCLNHNNACTNVTIQDPQEQEDALPSAQHEAAVLEKLGITYLYPYQRLVIANVLDALCNDDAEVIRGQIAILPTGYGKSICFQVPALMMQGITVIIYPLKGLIADQARRLAMCTKPVLCITGDTDQETWKQFETICADTADCIILTNPESLHSDRFASQIGKAPITHLVIDEAHCVAEWGDTFRPAYILIKDFIKKYNPKMVSAFTATASPPVLERIAFIIFEHIPYKLVMTTTDRPNIYYQKVWSINKNKTLNDLVALCEKPALIFTRSRTGAEILAHYLRIQLRSKEIYFYHAGLTAQEKKDVEAWFFSSEQGILTATCAYGMGMDKKNIRTVIHYDIPDSIEAYIQEAGRAGRDGELAKAILIAQWQANKHIQTMEISHTNYQPTQTLASLASSRSAQMLYYSHQDSLCRRNVLLAMMANEPVACCGCDVCDLHTHTHPIELELLIAIINAYPYQFSKHELTDFLKGIGNFSHLQGYGVLSAWKLTEIKMFIQELLQQGIIIEHSGIRKGIICASSRYHAYPQLQLPHASLH